MADASNDELEKGLKSAKKKPRNFAMVVKGTKLMHLIVSKKAIKAGEKAAAKKEAGGTGFVEGIVVGEGAELVFKIQGEQGGEPSIKIAQFKEYVEEATGMKIKPRFQMVSELEVVDENEEEGEENEADGPTPPVAPPPPQAEGGVPPAPPPPPADAMKALVAAMNKLSDGIKSAAAANPNQKGELLKHVAAFQGQVKAADASGAKESLTAVATMLKQMSGAPPVAPPPPAQGSDAAIPPAPPPPQGPAAETPPFPDRAAVDWEREFARVEPRYLEVVKNCALDAAEGLRKVFNYATQQSADREFVKALAALKRLEPMLDAAAQTTSGSSGEIEKGIVEKRKFMLTRMKAIPGEIQPSLNKLKAAIESQVPDENPNELTKAIEAALTNFYDQIQDEIDKAITAGNSKDLAGLKNRVMGNELLAHLYDNPLSDGAVFRDTLISALDEIEEKLAS